MHEEGRLSCFYNTFKNSITFAYALALVEGDRIVQYDCGKYFQVIHVFTP